jgi:hypothetical protein
MPFPAVKEFEHQCILSVFVKKKVTERLFCNKEETATTLF